VMTRRVGNIVIIEPEEERRCELCGVIEECRPYGPNGEQVCFSCGMKDKANFMRRMNKYLFNEGSA